MRSVAVNLLWLEPGVVGGSEEYTLGLLRAIDRIDPDDLELRLHARPSLQDAHPDLATRFEIITPPFGLSAKSTRIAAEATWLSKAVRADDLVHHAGGVAPLTTPSPFVVSVLDLQPLDLPENFSLAKRRWFATMLPSSVRRAAIVVTMTEFVAESIRRRFEVDESRLRVVSPGIDVDPAPHSATDSGPRTDDAVGAEREPSNRFGRFLLYPAIAYPHKRHIDLVEALALLPPELDDVSVVITGRSDRETDHVISSARELGLAHRVHLLGRVSRPELDQLYRSAAALVFPSVYEGFGLPLLEAMGAGCPVIATDATSIPEVVGDAGLLVPPCDPGSLAAAVTRVLADAELSRELAARGRDRVARFSWRSAGLCLLDAYRGALAQRTTS